MYPQPLSQNDKLVCSRITNYFCNLNDCVIYIEYFSFKKYEKSQQAPNLIGLKNTLKMTAFIFNVDTVPKNDPKVEVCVNEQPTIPGHVYTLGGSETTFHKIFTWPKKP